MTAPADREFQVFGAGYIRDAVLLAQFREGLRSRINPETRAVFTEDEIQRVTMRGSRFWREAEAIDQYGQLSQRRSIFMADQAAIDRSNSEWLRSRHGKMWNETHLPATGGAGIVTVPASSGTIVVGSSTLGDPTAYRARDPNGNLYQVFQTVVVPPGSSSVLATLAAVDTGDDTNPVAGVKLTWETRDPNMAPQATVASQFTGGTNRETDGEFISRLMGRVRHKPGAGNDPQMRAWARQSSNSVEDGLIYPVFLHAGSVGVAITQKRASVLGPAARMPNPATTLAQAIAYLVAPLSPVVPTPQHVVVFPANGETTDVVLRLSMAKGSGAGWTDARPFPSYHATTPKITNVTSNTEFQITAPGDATLPGKAALATVTGDDCPSMMVWNEAETRWLELAVSEVEDLGSNVYAVTLSSPPQTIGGTAFTIALNQIVSPDVGRRAIIGQAIEAYFDELGPGHLFDVENDVRGARGGRFPDPSEERQFRAGADLATRVVEDLGGGSIGSELSSISLTTPSYPTNLVLGPNMLVPGTVGLYPL